MVPLPRRSENLGAVPAYGPATASTVASLSLLIPTIVIALLVLHSPGTKRWVDARPGMPAEL